MPPNSSFLFSRRKSKKCGVVVCCVVGGESRGVAAHANATHRTRTGTLTRLSWKNSLAWSRRCSEGSCARNLSTCTSYANIVECKSLSASSSSVSSLSASPKPNRFLHDMCLCFFSATCFFPAALRAPTRPSMVTVRYITAELESLPRVCACGEVMGCVGQCFFFFLLSD